MPVIRQTLYTKPVPAGKLDARFIVLVVVIVVAVVIVTALLVRDNGKFQPLRGRIELLPTFLSM